MKTFDQLFLAATLSLVAPVAAGSQAPCICLSFEAPPNCGAILENAPVVNPGGNSVSFHLAEFTADLLPQPPADLTSYTDTTARYKAFWIMGDGNFLYSALNSWSNDLGTHSSSYAYNLADTYSPKVVLVEKKSNTDPPREPKRRLVIPSINTPGSGLNPRISGNNSMDIFNHERNRPDYPTVFVLSARKSNTMIDSFFFFFNCAHDLGANSFTPDSIHDAVKFMESPLYLNLPGAGPAVQDISNLPAHFSPIAAFLQQRFKNFISIPIGAVLDNSKNPFAETRVFPALNTVFNPGWQNGAGAITLPWGHYLVLATGREPVGKARPEDLETIVQARGYFTTADGPLLNAELRLSDTGTQEIQYIRGISSTDVQVVAAIDPNGLTVQEICPAGSNKYQVNVRMEVCNEGYMDQPSVTFVLKDASALFSKPEFGTADPSFSGAVNMAAGKAWAYSWQAGLPGIPLPDDTITAHVNTCKDLTFTTTTNWEGVKKLIDGKGLELCVQFSYGRPLCHFNDPIAASEVTPATGYKCLSPGTGVSCTKYCCLALYWIAFGILIILILLVWIIRRLQRLT